MPSKEETDAMFAALVSNGIEFIESSIAELGARPSFSVAHFATGVELLLKARLFGEHWTLVAHDPHSCAWTGIKDGLVTTVAASSLCAAVTSVTGTSLRVEQDVFSKVFAHRNRVLHFVPADDIATTAAEQCRAWYLLHNLLRRRWSSVFVSFADKLDEIDNRLLAHRPYLQARYDATELQRRGLDHAGRLFECPACRYRAAVLTPAAEPVSDFECLVCKTRGHVALVSCGRHLSLDEIPAECECGAEHDRDELLERLDPTPVLGPKESLTYYPDRSYCGECLDPEVSIVRQRSVYVCVACGQTFKPDDQSECQNCAETWFGYDTESSAYTGCEWCNGPEHRD
ncbi:hypothetical protein [Paraliomyxa miuraensis]|uniref:hypothetical protein n=1 Tax=Paraliomyxa miuraensis TaxID=376150 RepID=UPI00225B8D5D|nr:hypothetical protein [Paraliomyxa miuraensis]MCX4244225.1 hypothetical protein [Paraliomyxa miuraensis]